MQNTLGLTAALLILLSAAVSAQHALPPPEVGAGYGGLLVGNEGGDYTVGSTRPAMHLRVTLPFTPQFSFEGLTTISSSTSESAFHRTNGLYILQVKQRLRSTTGEGFHGFLTYGAAGYYARLHQQAITVTRSNGTQTVVSEYAFHHTDPPFFAAIGGGFQHDLGRRAAFRADAQVLTLLWVPMGVQLSAGISVPLGEYDPMPTRRTR